jgi:hypothetical protein
MTRTRIAGLVLALGFPTLAFAAGAPDELLARVPGDAILTLSVEDLRGHSREILDSPLAARLFGLPMVKEWQKQGGDTAIRKAMEEVEESLGISLPVIRDELLGDAVVLSLHAEPGGKEPRGLVQFRPRDRGLLERIVAATNASPVAGWKVQAVRAKSSGREYSIRTSAGGARPDEAYILFEDGTFAWSNSPGLIGRLADAIVGDKAGFRETPVYRSLSPSLPDRCFVRAYLNPAQFLASIPLPDDADSRSLADLLGSLRGAAFALEWREGPVVQLAVEATPAAWDKHWSAWLPKSSGGMDFRKFIPPEPYAVVGIKSDLAAIGRWILGQLPDEAKPRAEALIEATRGLLMGRDPVRDVLPALGPNLLAYLLGPKAEGEDPALVVMVAISDAGQVAPALNNALRTLFAFVALNGKPTPKLETRLIDRIEVTTLSGEGAGLAYGIEAGRLVFGTSPEAVVEAMKGQADRAGSTRFERARATYFPEGETFLYFDLEALTAFALGRRADWGRWLEEPDHAPTPTELDDFANALELLNLFRFAYLAVGVSEESRIATATFGLISREVPR